ncbi:unnamed protein product [Leuciscus chuanchicus]
MNRTANRGSQRDSAVCEWAETRHEVTSSRVERGPLHVKSQTPRIRRFLSSTEQSGEAFGSWNEGPLEKKRGQHEESAIVMDLATSGVAQDLQKTHVWTFSQMNHAAVQYSLANDSSLHYTRYTGRHHDGVDYGRVFTKVDRSRAVGCMRCPQTRAPNPDRSIAQSGRAVLPLCPRLLTVSWDTRAHKRLHVPEGVGRLMIVMNKARRGRRLTARSCQNTEDALPLCVQERERGRGVFSCSVDQRRLTYCQSNYKQQKRSSVYPPLPPPICPFICFYSQLASFTNPLFHFNNTRSSHHLIPRSSPP